MIICPGDGGLSHSFRIEMDHFSIASYNTFALYTTSGPHTRVLRPGFLVIHVALLASVDSIQFPADGGQTGEHPFGRSLAATTSSDRPVPRFTSAQGP